LNGCLITSSSNIMLTKMMNVVLWWSCLHVEPWWRMLSCFAQVTSKCAQMQAIDWRNEGWLQRKASESFTRCWRLHSFLATSMNQMTSGQPDSVFSQLCTFFSLRQENTVSTMTTLVQQQCSMVNMLDFHNSSIQLGCHDVSKLVIGFKKQFMHTWRHKRWISL